MEAIFADVGVALIAVVNAMRAMRYGINVNPYYSKTYNYILKYVIMKGINKFLLTLLVPFIGVLLHI